MTGATHAAIAVAAGMLAGCPKTALVLLAGGALLPDVDCPQSTIGRVLLPLSIPLNHRFGHRGLVHAFTPWLIVAFCAILYRGFLFIGIGAILHIVADCATLSGVRAFAPFSDKLVVLFRRSWRVRTGGNAEMMILIIVGLIAFSGGRITNAGGISAVLGTLTCAPKLMLEEYKMRGLEKCRFSGKIRWNDGSMEEGEWLIIGTEGSGLVFEKNGKLFRTPKDGWITRARLKPTGEFWKTAKILGFAKTEAPGYFLDGGKWYYAPPGEIVFGRFIADRIELSDESLLRLHFEDE